MGLSLIDKIKLNRYENRKKILTSPSLRLSEREDAERAFNYYEKRLTAIVKQFYDRLCAEYKNLI